MESKKPIRVLMIGMHDKIGGVETFLMNYLRNINREEVIFDFISTFKELCFEEEIIKLGGKVYHICSEKKNPFKYCKDLKKIIKQNNYSIVHINMLSAANILPVLVSKMVKVKHIIVHSHNSNVPAGVLRKILNFVNKPFLHLATNFYACSIKAGEWLYGKRFLKKHELVLINNAIDLEKYSFNDEDRENIRKELDISDKFVVGNIGRFSYQKNHEFLIDVFYEIQKQKENSVLLLIGEGELEEEIKKKIENLNIMEKVIFLGTTSAVGKYLQAMDVFVLPSRFEGLGIVAIESQVSGLKTFVSDVVPSEAEVTELLEKISLNESAYHWSEKIINDCIVNDRKKQDEKIGEMGFDIKIESIILQNRYIEMVK